MIRCRVTRQMGSGNGGQTTNAAHLAHTTLRMSRKRQDVLSLFIPPVQTCVQLPISRPMDFYFSSYKNTPSFFSSFYYICYFFFFLLSLQRVLLEAIANVMLKLITISSAQFFPNPLLLLYDFISDSSPEPTVSTSCPMKNTYFIAHSLRLCSRSVIPPTLTTSWYSPTTDALTDQLNTSNDPWRKESLRYF